MKIENNIKVLLFLYILIYQKLQHPQSTRSKKKEEVLDDVREEKAVGTIATVKDVLGRTGSRGGVIQVSKYIMQNNSIFICINKYPIYRYALYLLMRKQKTHVPLFVT